MVQALDNVALSSNSAASIRAAESVPVSMIDARQNDTSCMRHEKPLHGFWVCHLTVSS